MDIVRVQDVGLSSASDAAILEWAASEGRVLLSHDFATMPAEAGGETGAVSRWPVS